MLMQILVSCQKTDFTDKVATDGQQQVTLTLALADYMNTRGTATEIAQYIMEVYSDETYTTPLNIFENGTKNQAISATSSFSIILNPKQVYYCLFWANKDATIYTTSSIKAVTVNKGKKPTEAWFGSEIINSTETLQTVTLKRAVSKLNLLEMGKMFEGTTISATFEEPTVFNVANGEIARGENDANLVSRTEIIKLTDAVDGTTTPVKLNSTDYFILSPATTQYVTTVTFKSERNFIKEDDFNVDNVPLQANHVTNIKGIYSKLYETALSVMCNDDWTDYYDVKIDSESLALGDYYYDDETHSTNYNNSKTVLGIVFWIDPNDASKGKIISLDEGRGRWGAVNDEENDGVESIRNTLDGSTATKNLIKKRKDDADFSINYFAFNWIYATKNNYDVDGRWYFPARDELSAICEWYRSDKKGNNLIITKAGGTELLNHFYSSSSEIDRNFAWYVDFLDNTVTYSPKKYDDSVRAILAF